MNGFDTLRALMYLRANPGVPVATFVKDHAPIGNILWTDLFYADCVTLDPANCLFLTLDGLSVIDRAYAAMGEQP